MKETEKEVEVKNDGVAKAGETEVQIERKDAVEAEVKAEIGNANIAEVGAEVEND